MANISRARQFGSTALVYFLGTVLSKLVSLLLLPLYTRLLSPAEYGTYDLWFTLCAFLAPVTFFQIWDALYRFYFTVDNRAQAVTNALGLMCVGAVAYTLTMGTALIVLRPGVELWVYLFGLSLAGQYCLGFLARGEMKNSLFVVTGLANTVVSASLTVVLLLFADMGPNALFAGLTIGNASQVIALASRLKIFDLVDLQFLDRATMRAMLQYSVPLSFASVAYWMLSGYTRAVLTIVAGPSANGLYAVADRFAVAIVVTSTVVMYAWQEYLYSGSGDEKGSAETSSRGFRVITASSLIVASGTLSFVHFGFGLVIADTYHDSYDLIPFVVLSATFNTVASTAGAIYMAKFRTGWLMWSTVGAAMVNVVLGLAFTQLWGALGAALALMFSLAILAVVRTWSLRSSGFGFVDRYVAIATLLLAASLSAFYMGGALTNGGLAVLALALVVVLALSLRKQV